MDSIISGYEFLLALPPEAYLTFFFITILAEIPRYAIGLQATAAAVLFRRSRADGPLPSLPKISILLVGHNEEDAIEKCVGSLRAQSFNRFEIVCVDDGSTDRTFALMKRLRRSGLVTTIARLQLRGGKSAGINYAARLAAGDIFVVVDCDCSFEHDAIEELLRPLAENRSIMAVSGNILVRNWRSTITASLQGIEYLISISLGKTFSDVLGQVACVSGAYGAFRRGAWESIGGMDVGGAEDLDFTIRLRDRGHKVVFANRSICYTDVPASLSALVRQRSRWERDCYMMRIRKYGRLMNPFSVRFSWSEAAHQWDFLLFNLLPTVATPIYIAWLFLTFESFGLVILVAVALALFLFDLAAFVAALLVTQRPVYWRLLAFLPLYSLHQSYLMRWHRAYAYITEAIYSLSLNDNYVPAKSRRLATWR